MIPLSAPLTESFSHRSSFKFRASVNGSYTFCLGDANYHLNGGELFIAYPNEIHSTNQLPMPVGEIYQHQKNRSSQTAASE